MAMRSVMRRAGVKGLMKSTRGAARQFNDGKGRILIEEEYAAENVFIQPLHLERRSLVRNYRMGSMVGASDEVMMKVKVCKRESVAAMLAAMLPVQEHWLPFSNLDLLMPAVDASVFFCYIPPAYSGDKNSNAKVPSFGSMVGDLKVSLAKVLVPYYAFAGEIVVNSCGEPELLCNNSGVDFIEAVADIELQDLDLHNFDESIEGKLVPSKKRGVLAVQATKFRCGGIVVGCTFDHRIADGYSSDMFLASWAEMCRSSSISIFPSFRRSLLYPRYSSGHQDLGLIDNMYMPVSELPPQLPDDQREDNLISHIYYVPANQLQHLQQLASTDNCKRSKLVSFSSFVWKMMAKSFSSFSGNDDYAKASNSRMGIAVDGRSRLPGDMTTYFGNVVSNPFGEKRVSELAEKPLSWVADGVHKFVQAGATREHFLGLIDWVEDHRPVPGLPRILCKGPEDAGPPLVVSSGLRFSALGIDFGWGRPAFGSYYIPKSRGGEVGYALPMPSPRGNGDWLVYMILKQRQLSFVESEAAHIFRPLTFDYLTYK